MSLKSIRESYSKLLNVFNDTGIQLNESQKSDLDTFVLALESTMSKEREDAIRKTKVAVTEKLEREYQKIFESIMSNYARNTELKSKIAAHKIKLDEHKKIADDVNDYLELYVESVLPKKDIVDYHRMRKLEKINESLREVLLVNDDKVIEKQTQLEESFKHDKSKLETEVAKIQVKLNESMKKVAEQKKKLDQYKAKDLLESKLANMPSFEANRIKKALSEATVSEIEEKFDAIRESVQNDAAKLAKEQETTMESEIEKIVKEDDIIKNRTHNLHTSVSEAEAAKKQVADTEDDETFETTEQVNFNDSGDVELDESEKIDTDTMSWYCRYL